VAKQGAKPRRKGALVLEALEVPRHREQPNRFAQRAPAHVLVPLGRRQIADARRIPEMGRAARESGEGFQLWELEAMT
jgi:hypothetical protein